MIFTVFTEASLFAYLLFSYYYLAVQPHLPGTFPQGGPPILTLGPPNTIVLLLSSAAVAWAQFGIERGRQLRLVAGLGIGAALGMSSWSSSISNGLRNPSALASSPYSSLYFTVTGFHMAPCGGRSVHAVALTYGRPGDISTACAMPTSISARSTGISWMRYGWRCSSPSTSRPVWG